MDDDIYSDVVEHISWEDFLKAIKVIKLLNKREKTVEYLAQYKLNNQKYNSSITFDMNEEYFEDMEYFDSFGHDQLAEDLYRQVMGKKKVNNNSK